MTKQELRETIRKAIQQELSESSNSFDEKQFKDGLYNIEKPFMQNPEAIDAMIKILETEVQSLRSIKNREFSLDENTPAPSKPSPTTKPAVAPGKPAEKKPRRPLGNPNVKPERKMNATMKEAEMLKQVIKRFKSKK